VHKVCLQKTLGKTLGYNEHEIIFWYVICVTRNLYDISKEQNTVRTLNYKMSQLAWRADPMR